MRKIRKYDREFRISAAKHYESSGKSLREVALPVFRTWLEPQQISLVQSEDGRAMVFDEVKMQCLANTTIEGKKVLSPLHEAFARHFTDNYDIIAEEYPIFSEVKRLGGITGVVKWMKDNNIPVDLSFFDSYAPNAANTPMSIPAHASTRNFGEALVTIRGGIIFALNDGNYFVKESPSVKFLSESVIEGRPSDEDFIWEVNGLTAQAFPLAKVRKKGAFIESFTDLEYPVPGDFPLSFLRTYNSFEEQDIGLGIGWSLTPFKVLVTRKEVFSYEERSFLASSKLVVREQGEDWVYTIHSHDTEGKTLYVREDGQQFFYENPDHTYTLCFKGKEAFFNEQGQLTQLIDSNGIGINYTYEEGRLCAISHQNGKVIHITYDGDRIKLIEGSRGETAFYAHSRELLIEVSRQGFPLETYAYDDDFRLTQIHFDEKEAFKGEYDTYNRLIRSQVDEEVSYNKAGLISSVKDERGGVCYFFYDQNKNLVIKEHPVEGRTGFTYDQNGRLISTVRHLFLVGKERGDLFRSMEHTPAFSTYCTTEGMVTVGYHKEHRVDIEYNNIGRVERVTIGDEVSLFSYDENGLLLGEIDSSGYETIREYGEQFRVKSVSDRKGPLISFVFDDEGRVKEEITPSGKTSYKYGVRGEVTQEVDKLGNFTEFTYNTRGLLVQTVDAEGSIFSLR